MSNTFHCFIATYIDHDIRILEHINDAILIH